MKYINKEIIEEIRNIVAYYIKTIGSNLRSGKSITNIPMPIKIFDDFSNLERISK